MRITGVGLYVNNSVNGIDLSFRDQSSNNPYQVKTILGLDADEIISRSYGGSGRFVNQALPKRDVTLHIVLNPDFSEHESFSDLRDKVYRLISSDRSGSVEIRFMDGETIVAVLKGRISKVEAPQFTKELEMHVTVSCKDPILRGVWPQTIEGANELDPENTVIQDDISTAPHGFTFTASFNTATYIFSIQDETESWLFEMNMGWLGGFLPGDMLHFSSENNNKYFWLQRDGNTLDLVDLIATGAVWPLIFPGTNIIKATPGFSWVQIDHFSAFWGV